MGTIGHAAAGAIRVEPSESRTTISLVGEVDGALRDEASASMAVALVHGRPVVVDATAATFVDSSGVAFVVQLHRAAAEAGIPVTLQDPRRVLREVLELVGMSDLLRDEPAGRPAG